MCSTASTCISGRCRRSRDPDRVQDIIVGHREPGPQGLAGAGRSRTFCFADAERADYGAVAPERRARRLPADGRRALRVRGPVGVGRLGRGVRHRERPDACAVAARDAPAGRRASANGRTRSSAWRAMPDWTSCASAWIDGRWKRRWSSSRPSGGSGRCDEQDQGFSNHSRFGGLLVGLVLWTCRLRAGARATAPAPRPSIVVPQGTPPPPRPAQPAGPVMRLAPRSRARSSRIRSAAGGRPTAAPCASASSSGCC